MLIPWKSPVIHVGHFHFASFLPKQYCLFAELYVGAQYLFAGAQDTEHKHPWYAPGTAHIASPCGTLGIPSISNHHHLYPSLRSHHYELHKGGWPLGCNFG